MTIAGDVSAPLAERLMSGIEYDTNGGCWLWAASREESCRGRLTVYGRGQVLAARASFETFKGPIPDGLFVCHHCDVPACIRPDHLFAGTAQDNVDDMIRKGRRVQAEMPRGEDHQLSKLSESEVLIIRALRGVRGDKAVGHHFGMTRNAVASIWSRRCWAWLAPRPLSQAEQMMFDEARAAVLLRPTNRKLSETQLEDIRAEAKSCGVTALGRRYGVSHSLISMIVSGKHRAASHGIALGGTE